MAISGGTLAVDVTGDIRRLNSDISGAGKHATSTFATAAKKIGLLLGGAFIGTKIVGFFKESALLAEKSATANALLEQTLRNAGFATNEVADRQKELAKAISRTSGYQDEEIKSAQGILATFHVLSGTADEVGGAFDRSTQAIVDMAASGFGSLQDNAKQVGKALQDPVQGISALTRSGLTFTAEQKNMVKAWVETGETAKAQNFILEEIEKQVGGVAAETADASAIMATAWNDSKEAIGTLLLPAMQGLAGFMSETLAPAIENIVNWFKDDVGPALTDAKEKLEEWEGPIKTIAGIITALMIPTFVRMAASAVVSAATTAASWAVTAAGSVAAAAVNVASGFIINAVWLGLKIKAAVSAAAQFASWVLSGSGSVVAAATTVASNAILLAVWLGLKIQAGISAAAQFAAWILSGVTGPAMAVIGAVVAFAVVIAGWIGMAITATINAIIVAAAWLIAFWPVALAIAAIIAIIAIVWIFWDEIKAALAKVWEFVKMVFGKIVDAIKAAWEWIKESAQKVWEWIKEKFQAIKDFVVGVWEGIKAKVQAVITYVKGRIKYIWEQAKHYFELVRDKVREVIDKVISFVKELPGKVKDALSNAANWLVSAGKDMIRGLLSGAGEILSGIRDWVKKNIVDKITGAVKSLFGIGSPSKVMAGLGEDTAEGMAVGIKSGMGEVEGLLARLTAPVTATHRVYADGSVGQAGTVVQVFIGDQELRGIVRTEVVREDQRTALGVTGGRR